MEFTPATNNRRFLLNMVSKLIGSLYICHVLEAVNPPTFQWLERTFQQNYTSLLARPRALYGQLFGFHDICKIAESEVAKAINEGVHFDKFEALYHIYGRVL